MISNRHINKVAATLSKDYAAGRFDNLNEANTQDKLIQPFLEAFGWDFSSDNVSAQKILTGGKKPDYVLKINGNIKVVIEVKTAKDIHLEPHISQLAEYFNNSDAHIGILTNGIQYWFFSWYPKKAEMNPTPFAIVDIRELDLNNADSFLMYFRQDKFNATFFKWYSHADYISGRSHALLGAEMDTDPKTKKLAKSAFFTIFSKYRLDTASIRNLPDRDESTSSRKLTSSEISTLWEFTQHHSRWAFRKNKTRVKPMK